MVQFITLFLKQGLTQAQKSLECASASTGKWNNLHWQSKSLLTFKVKCDGVLKKML